MFLIFQSRCRAALASRCLAARKKPMIRSRAACFAACLWHVFWSTFACFLGAHLALVRSRHRLCHDATVSILTPACHRRSRLSKPPRGARGHGESCVVAKRMRPALVARLSTRLRVQPGSRFDKQRSACSRCYRFPRAPVLLKYDFVRAPRKHVRPTKRRRTHPDRVSKKILNPNRLQVWVVLGWVVASSYDAPPRDPLGRGASFPKGNPKP